MKDKNAVRNSLNNINHTNMEIPKNIKEYYDKREAQRPEPLTISDIFKGVGFTLLLISFSGFFTSSSMDINDPTLYIVLKFSFSTLIVGVILWIISDGLKKHN